YSSLYEIISTSIITLSEAIEAQFFSSTHNSFPLIATKLIASYIVRATYNKNDTEAFETLLKAGMLLGLANADRKKCSLFSCFIIPIIRKVDVSFSIALAIMLPYLMEVYRHINEGRGIKIAQEIEPNLTNKESAETY